MLTMIDIAASYTFRLIMAMQLIFVPRDPLTYIGLIAYACRPIHQALW